MPAQAHLLQPDTPVARYNIAPTQPVAAIRAAQDGGDEWALFYWGLIPSWAKDPSIGAKMINARAETAPEKPSFRSAFKRRRCIVPMDGFYEWQKAGGSKIPHFIHQPDRLPFGVAGLWEVWHSPDGGAVASCTLLTTEPNRFMATLHNRMPVILDPQDYEQWLHDDRPDQLRHLLRPCADDLLTAYAVSTYVNRPVNEGPACIVPLAH